MEQGVAQPETIFDRIGHDGFQRLVAGFYRRVANDDDTAANVS